MSKRKLSGEDLADYLQGIGIVKSDAIYNAFAYVARADFLPYDIKKLAQVDSALQIGYGQTNSQPYTVAFMLEQLQPEKGQKILDVGSGSGWTTALLAHIVGKTGKVTGVEVVSELVSFGQDNLNKYNFPWARIEEASDIFGWPQGAPYDRILVSASAKEIPKSLIDQLSDDGIMVVPVQESIWRVAKIGKKMEKEEFPGFMFVPLV